jgi:hypothetical protein
MIKNFKDAGEYAFDTEADYATLYQIIDRIDEKRTELQGDYLSSAESLEDFNNKLNTL